MDIIDTAEAAGLLLEVESLEKKAPNMRREFELLKIAQEKIIKCAMRLPLNSTFLCWAQILVKLAQRITNTSEKISYLFNALDKYERVFQTGKNLLL